MNEVPETSISAQDLVCLTMRALVGAQYTGSRLYIFRIYVGTCKTSAHEYLRSSGTPDN